MKMLKFKINKDLLPMKGHYFFWNAGTSPIVPFMSVYAGQLGFSSFIVGIIYTILPFSGMLAKPLMGVLADKFRCRKFIFLVAQLVAAVAFLAMIFLPELPQGKSLNQAHFACDNFEAVTDICLDKQDKYALNRIKSIVSDEITCQMNCDLTSSQSDIVCKNWLSSENCQFLNNISFTAHIPINHTLQLVHCLYFKVSNVTLNNGQTVYPTCPLHSQISTSCSMNCSATVINDMLVKVEEPNVTGFYQFWLLLSIYLIAWVGQAVTVSVADTLCFQLLGDKPHKYGYQRMMGALGWGIFSMISGVLVDVLSDGVKKNYAPVFGMGIGLIVICIIVSSQIQYSQQEISSNIFKDICVLLLNIRIIVYALWCICMGICTALIWNFLFWLLEELARNHSWEVESKIKTIEGLAMGIQSLGGELPFFFLSSWILKRIGHINAMSLVLLVVGLRFMYYSVITNPWWCLPIEFTNGITFGLFYATMASYASIVAPPGTETTTQGLVGAVFEGIGVSSGSFLGGLLMENYGGSKTFRIFGIFALTASLVHALVQFLLQRSEKYSKDSTARYAAPQDAIHIFNEELQEFQDSL